MKALILLSEIEAAFKARPRPESVVRSDAPDTDEYDDARFFAGKTWESVRCADFRQHPAAFSGFSPDALCYYLQSILHCTVKEEESSMNAVDTLVYMLDRGNSPSSWEDFFIERWCSLGSDECRVIQAWLIWLQEVDPMAFSDSELTRAVDTLELLVHRSSATPIAQGSRSRPL